jgi:hypothetical protein
MQQMSKIRKAAQGRECQIRIPGICNGNPETTVLCHLPGGGMGAKQNDLFASFGCSDCHAYVDGGFSSDTTYLYDPGITGEIVSLYHHEGVIRTQEILLKEGLIKI